MPHPSDKIASLIGSRICHDLISPVGAVANGLELMELSGQPQSPELSLVAESAAHASARIQLFRLAFGEAAPGQTVAGHDVAGIVDIVYRPGRVAVTWDAPGEYPRWQAKAALLALMCAELTLAGGGRIGVTQARDRWRIGAMGARLTPDPDLWNILTGAPAPEGVTPAAVQFVLLPQVLAKNGVNCNAQVSGNKLEISF